MTKAEGVQVRSVTVSRAPGPDSGVKSPGAEQRWPRAASGAGSVSGPASRLLPVPGGAASPGPAPRRPPRPGRGGKGGGRPPALGPVRSPKLRAPARSRRGAPPRRVELRVARFRKRTRASCGGPSARAAGARREG
uniref:Chromosome 8 open reading frame 40 n=1 Tax=Pan troglodytes TaxID=9598 RepID=K7B826_PANTR